MVDQQGVQLAVTHSEARVHDSKLLEGMLGIIQPIKRPQGRRRKRPDKLQADKTCQSAKCFRALHQRGITPRIARRGIDSSEQLYQNRWVAGLTLAWLNRYRRLQIRYTRRANIHQAFLSPELSLICWDYLQQEFFTGSRSLGIAPGIELPPDCGSGEIAFQVIECFQCDFAGIAIYEESRRGAFRSESFHQIRNRVSREYLKALTKTIAERTEPGNWRYGYPAHHGFSRKDASGWWNALDDIS